MLFRRVPKKTEPKMKSIDWFRDPFSYPTQILCWSRVNRTQFKPTAAEKFEWKRFNILIEFAYIIHRLLVEFEFEFVSENNWPASSRRLSFANDTVCEVAVQNINETLNTFKCGHRKEQPTHSLMSFASVFHMPSVLCESRGERLIVCASWSGARERLFKLKIIISTISIFCGSKKFCERTNWCAHKMRAQNKHLNRNTVIYFSGWTSLCKPSNGTDIQWKNEMKLDHGRRGQRLYNG